MKSCCASSRRTPEKVPERKFGMVLSVSENALECDPRVFTGEDDGF